VDLTSPNDLADSRLRLRGFGEAAKLAEPGVLALEIAEELEGLGAVCGNRRRSEAMTTTQGSPSPNQNLPACHQVNS
jgi:hypothetical protein